MATPRNSPSILVIFLKDNHVFSLVPRSLEHKQLDPFSVLIPFSMSADCSISEYFPWVALSIIFQVLPLSRNVFSPSSFLTLILIWNMCFLPDFPVSFPQTHSSLLLLQEFLWLSVALLAITPMFA